MQLDAVSIVSISMHVYMKHQLVRMCSFEVVEVKDGIENVWHAFQWAVSAVGLHVTQGDIIWEVYREFDDIFLDILQIL
ncbi:spliceosome associated factor 3, U4/U6 recycling protein-like [Tachypleus tridentatus]|uniref:spliceosome associated factor 3, U4/U6 recycling protein-like n=1 Tax=Tachypleus tridentatus TaxID=6853 RepID=UPI003FD5D3F4